MCMTNHKIYSRVLPPYCLYLSDVSRKEENIHGIQEKLTDNILFKQCQISHIQQPGARAKARDGFHGHSLTAAGRNENINVWQKDKSTLPLLGSGGLSLYPLPPVTLCIRYPEWAVSCQLMHTINDRIYSRVRGLKIRHRMSQYVLFICKVISIYCSSSAVVVLCPLLPIP